MKQLVLFFSVIQLLFATGAQAQADPLTKFGPIGNEPRLLAPGFINTGLATRDVTMSPDGRELYFCATTAGYAQACIMVTRFDGGEWTEPEVVSFSGSMDYVDLEPALSPDGESLFFYSSRPVTAGGENAQDLWVSRREGDKWGEPSNLGEPVNTAAPEFFPSVTSDGTLYFCRADDATRRHSIFRSRLVDGQYQTPELLPAEVNSGTSQFNAWVSPDESLLIVPTAGREDNLGGVDYWLCRRNPDDTWLEPVNLGPVVNDGSRQAWSPYMSPDKKYFFFMAARAEGPEMSWPVSWSELQYRQKTPGSGRPGIYVMKADFLTELGQETTTTEAKENKPIYPAPYANKPGRYWGQKKPSLTPEIFAPGRISTGLTERDIILSPDGRYLMYGIMDMGLVTTMVAEWQDDRWSEPMTAPWHLSNDFACFEPTLSPDGKTVYFLSNQAAPGQTPKRGWGNQNIFTSHYADGAWSEPAALPAPVTSESAEYFPSMASDGTLYFCRENDEGKSAIWTASPTADGFAEPVRLPAEVNVGPNNYNAFVALDQSLIIVCVGDHEENLGPADYWVSFRSDDGTWSPARNMGPQFNGEDTRASSAYLSPDGEVLFFSSTRTTVGSDAAEEKLTRARMLAMLTEPGAGSSDLWWVDADVLESMKP